jgi:hypothetical protein
MLGAAYYLAWRRAQLRGEQAPDSWLKEVPCDSLAPLARHITLRETWQAFLPWTLSKDRGICLEEDWVKVCFPFQDLRDHEERGEVPSLIFSPMLVDDGRRLLISNLDLWELTRCMGGQVTFNDPGRQRQCYSLSALEFYRLFPLSRDFHLATAVRMNASFPYISPSVNLPTNPPRRVVDAGYYDNYGIQVASAWAYKNQEWLAGSTSGVLLVQIRASLSQMERLEIADAPTSFWATLSRGFEFLTSPAEGAGNALTASALFRNDQDVGELSDLFTARKEYDRPFFTTVVFENSADVTEGPHDPASWPGDPQRATHVNGNVALNWYLSQAEREGMKTAIPTPIPDSPWCKQEVRVERINQLQADADASSGPQRDWLLKQLEQAKNYERLVQLKLWWAR